MAVKKWLYLFLLPLPLMGSSCLLPQRPHTFLPPTNLQNTCESSPYHFYSAIYEFCIIFPNENWSRISVSLPIDILGTDITTYSFFSQEEQLKVFTLYVADPTIATERLIEREQVPLIHKSPYLVGYTLNPDNALPPDLVALQDDVEKAVETMQFGSIASQ